MIKAPTDSHNKRKSYQVKIEFKKSTHTNTHIPDYMDNKCFMKFGHISNTIECDTNTPNPLLSVIVMCCLRFIDERCACAYIYLCMAC